jgi:hypothetical protein
VELTVRPMVGDDVERAREIQTRAFERLDAAHGQPPTEMTPEVRERQRRRLRHFLDHDPHGAWAATVDGTLAGVALALRRRRS